MIECGFELDAVYLRRKTASINGPVNVSIKLRSTCISLVYTQAALVGYISVQSEPNIYYILHYIRIENFEDF